MTEHEIQMRLYLKISGCSWMAPSIFLFNGFESDFIAVTNSGYIREYEIKLSLSDFYNDSRKSDGDGKTKYGLLESGKLSTEFTYVFPEGLIPYDKIPLWAGIIEVTKSFNFNYIRQPKRLNKTKITEGQIKTICLSLHYRYWELQRRRIKEKAGQILML